MSFSADAVPTSIPTSSVSLYHNKVMAAPMVRVSTLGFRLLCARHGAHVVWTEELVSAKLAKCVRRYLPHVNIAAIDAMPERFSSVLKVLFPIAKAEDDAAKANPETNRTSQKVADIIHSWRRNHLPFIDELLLAGRVEVVFAGQHQQPKQTAEQKKANNRNTNSTSAAATNDSFATAAAAAVLGEDESRPGEIVFSTLASTTLSPQQAALKLQQQNSGANKQHVELKQNLLSKLGLYFPGTEAGATLIGQFGVFDPAVAVAGMELLSPFVAGLDINQGCPKAFSVKNGMGAALMVNRDNAAAIMKAMATSFAQQPLSFKTRLFEQVPESLVHLRAMYRATKEAGNPIHAMTLHSRHRPQRSETAPLYDDAAHLVRLIRADAELKHLCLIFNGSVAMRDPPAASDVSASAASSPTAPQDTKANAAATTPAVSTSRKEIDSLILREYSGNAQIFKDVSRLGFNGALVARASMWQPSVFAQTQMACDVAQHHNQHHLSPSPPPRALALNVALWEFQLLLISYCAAGDQSRYLKYHLTRALPEYQQSDIARGLLTSTAAATTASPAAATATMTSSVSFDGTLYRSIATGRPSVEDAAVRMPAALDEVFIGVRDGKTMAEYAKALHFSVDEIAALDWLVDFCNWRRASQAVPEAVVAPTTAAAAGAASTKTATATSACEIAVAQRRDRDDDGK